MPVNYVFSHPSYVFFNTYLGLILQVLPLSLLAGLVFLWRERQRGHAFGRRRALRFLLVCYLAGLLAMTLIPQNLTGELWHRLIYGSPGGWDAERFLRFGGFNFIPDFFVRFRRENLANLVLFLPFGVLSPLSQPHLRCGTIVARGFALSLAIEVLQPFLGRSFDTNDLILNTLGAAVGAVAVFALRKRKKRRAA